MDFSLDTIRTRQHGGVLSATFSAPPMNLIGPEVVRDLVTLLDELADERRADRAARPCYEDSHGVLPSVQ